MSKHILISRTDAIGDVILTLPMCGLIKSQYPTYKISFLGNSYTQDVIQTSTFVDNFINVDAWKSISDDEIITQLKDLEIDIIFHVLPKKRLALIAKRAGIDLRVGTENRIFHWLTCNKLVSLSRKNSILHETQLNIKLLQALDIGGDFSLKELSEYYGLSKLPPLSEEQKMLLSDKRFNLLIHPKSRGSASEWSLENYADLIKRLDTDRYKIFITGTEKEQLVLSEWIEALGDKVTDLTGRFTLIQFMSFIQSCDGLLASSTGPLHLAAATRIHALGLYTSTKSVNSRRWAPVGCKAEFIEAQGNNINLINPAQVFDRILSWTNE